MPCSVTKLTMDLIKCPSISPNDAGCQELIVKRLSSINFNVEFMNFYDTKNLWAWRGNGKTLVFLGHTDVVPAGDISLWNYNPFKPIIKNNLLFGRGASDMKGSLAAMIVATENFIANNPKYKGRIAFLITSDEEGNAKNGIIKAIKKLMLRKEKIDYCLIGEPTSIKSIGDTIKNGRRGSLTCNLVVHGMQGHIAYPHLANNPIHLAIPMLNELISLIWDHGNTFFPPTSMQIFDINSNSIINVNNVIPNDLILKFNFRFNNNLTEQNIKKQILFLLEKYKLKYTIDWFLHSQPFITKQGKLLDVVIKAIKQYAKIVPQISNSGGSSDGRFIASTGAEIIELGLMNTTVHKVDEYVNISDLNKLMHIYKNIIERLLF